MAEQTGCIYMECPCGHLHASIWSDVIFRRPSDFGICEPGESGLIQVLSLLPRSYPGHSLLTEDMGVLLGRLPLRTFGQVVYRHGAGAPGGGEGVQRHL